MEYKPQNETCQNCKKDFIIEPDDFGFYEKMNVPAPTWCPECRLQRKMLWRNEHFLYRRKDEKTGKVIFSGFPPTALVNVMDVGDWYGDNWNQNESGRKFDWGKPFFVQFSELLKVAPIPSRAFNQPIVNSDYCNNVSYLKNCYLVFGAVTGKDCSYCENIVNCTNCLDSSLCSNCELCYEGFFNHRSYRTVFSSYCEDCINVSFCFECVNCSDCLGCVGLKNKKFHIFNEPYTKDEYIKKVKSYNLQNFTDMQDFNEQFKKFRLQFPIRFTRSMRNENCIGEYITNSKNVQKSYFVDGGENLKYCHSMYSKPSKDSYDQYRYGENSELMYECCSSGGHSSECMFCYQVYKNSFDVQYSFLCTNLSHSFGCVGLHNKEYCILNQQYSKEEYESMLPKIIEHMKNMPYVDANGRVYSYGEFFPPEIARFSYNESVAQEFFPLTKEQAESSGYLWRTIDRSKYVPEILAENLPNIFDNNAEYIVGKVITCAHEGKCSHVCNGVFKIIQSEFDFYKRLGLSLPHLCFECRYRNRIAQRAPIKLWHRKCMCDKSNHTHKGKCITEFETSYAPERLEIVYCERCYQQEVY